MADLNQKLKELFRKVNISGERSEFHARKQRVGESITNYMSSLRELASSCNFGTMEDDMTCVQLVEFNNNSQVREKLVSKTYTLEQAVQIAKEIEKGANTARDMLQKAATNNSTSQTARRTAASPKKQYSRFTPKKSTICPNETSTPARPKRSCYRCSSQKHLANDPTCPAINACCCICQKLGHYSKVCQSGSTPNKEGLVDTTTKFNQSHLYDEHANESNNYLQNEISSDCKQNFVILYIDSAQTQYVYSAVKVKPVNFVIDTGSTVSLINSDTHHSHFANCKLLPTDVNLSTFDGRNTETEGYFIPDFESNSTVTKSKL